MKTLVRHLPLLLVPALVAGCASKRPPAPAAATPASVEMIDDPVPLEWRSVITPADQGRLARTDEAWRTGLAAAAGRFRAAVRGEAELLDPAAALPRPAPPPGPYLCRTVRLGAPGAGYATFKPWNCYVEAEGELLTIVKQTGSKRPAGRLWPDGEKRLVFLGAEGLGQEGEAPPYGEFADRDLAGYVERVAPFRWRLVVPWPNEGGALEVYELIPVTPQPGGPKPKP